MSPFREILRVVMLQLQTRTLLKGGDSEARCSLRFLTGLDLSFYTSRQIVQRLLRNTHY